MGLNEVDRFCGFAELIPVASSAKMLNKGKPGDPFAAHSVANARWENRTLDPGKHVRQGGGGHEESIYRARC